MKMTIRKLKNILNRYPGDTRVRTADIYDSWAWPTSTTVALSYHQSSDGRTYVLMDRSTDKGTVTTVTSLKNTLKQYPENAIVKISRDWLERNISFDTVVREVYTRNSDSLGYLLLDAYL